MNSIDVSQKLHPANFPALRPIQKLRWTTVRWWTGRDLNPRPYGAGLVPSRKQGPVAGPAKRAIFGLTLSVYQADLPAHKKTRTT
ncbi:hypothetical protein E6H17_02400 [Candidatus Bathyarchaeota archaeon]|nr:MAG: hypothetical protein E6H17_02400 [Candidatus Bathyarchaeota archaeon]TMI76422.1 MAG: hypothetical protein E6H11_00625 [Candidatus Bathyarchaeota archaeon]